MVRFTRRAGRFPALPCLGPSSRSGRSESDGAALTASSLTRATLRCNKLGLEPSAVAGDDQLASFSRFTGSAGHGGRSRTGISVAQGPELLVLARGIRPPRLSD